MSKQRALVTGASNGLGAYVARRLAEDGWAVVGLGLRPETGTPTVDGVEYVEADLSDPASVATVAAHLGDCPDLIVHCAVVYPHHPGPASDERPPVDLESVFRVNAFAPYELTLKLLSGRTADQFCTCVVVNSEAIFHADEHSGPYAASKAALRVLTTALAGACRSGSGSVSTLLLGPLATPDRMDEIHRIAVQRGWSDDRVAEVFLSRSNPDLVIRNFIDLEACYRSITYIVGLGAAANGMQCRLDGGSAGSLI